jgi:hypothetical protein
VSNLVDTSLLLQIGQPDETVAAFEPVIVRDPKDKELKGDFGEPWDKGMRAYANAGWFEVGEPAPPSVVQQALGRAALRIYAPSTSKFTLSSLLPIRDFTEEEDYEWYFSGVYGWVRGGRIPSVFEKKGKKQIVFEGREDHVGVAETLVFNGDKVQKVKYWYDVRDLEVQVTTLFQDKNGKTIPPPKRKGGKFTTTVPAYGALTVTYTTSFSRHTVFYDSTGLATLTHITQIGGTTYLTWSSAASGSSYNSIRTRFGDEEDQVPLNPLQPVPILLRRKAEGGHDVSVQYYEVEREVVQDIQVSTSSPPSSPEDPNKPEEPKGDPLEFAELIGERQTIEVDVVNPDDSEQHVTVQRWTKVVFRNFEGKRLTLFIDPRMNP